jgi:hypothetical protein
MFFSNDFYEMDINCYTQECLMVANTKFYAKQVNKIAREMGGSGFKPGSSLWSSEPVAVGEICIVFDVFLLVRVLSALKSTTLN